MAPTNYSKQVLAQSSTLFKSYCTNWLAGWLAYRWTEVIAYPCFTHVHSLVPRPHPPGRKGLVTLCPILGTAQLGRS